jgi:hypothetical protein
MTHVLPLSAVAHLSKASVPEHCYGQVSEYSLRFKSNAMSNQAGFILNRCVKLYYGGCDWLVIGWHLEDFDWTNNERANAVIGIGFMLGKLFIS